MPCIIRSLALVATAAFLGLPALAEASSLTSLAEAMAELDTTNAVGRTFDLTCLLCQVPAAEADRNNRQISLREGRQYGEAFFVRLRGERSALPAAGETIDAVKKQFSAIFQKLGVTNRAEAVALATKAHLFS